MQEDTKAMGEAFARLCDMMARLRAPDGCGWDREQDLHSLRPYLLEETHEVLDVLDRLAPDGSGPADEHRDELGDLMLQVVFQAQIQREHDRFDAGDVANAIHDKLVRRHPHIFDPAYEGPERPDWEALKQTERKREGKRAGALSGVPKVLPALLRAYRVGEKAHRVGFDWPDTDGVLAKVDEELAEVKETLAPVADRARFEEEIGDLLYALVNLCRHLSTDPEAALRRTIARFENRFALVESMLDEDGKDAQTASLDVLEGYWERAKAQLKGRE